LGGGKGHGCGRKKKVKDWEEGGLEGKESLLEEEVKQTTKEGRGHNWVCWYGVVNPTCFEEGKLVLKGKKILKG